jgi:hypothetical protein
MNNEKQYGQKSISEEGSQEQVVSESDSSN